MVDPGIYAYHAILGTRLLSVLVNRPSHFCHAAYLSDQPQVKGILAQMSRESAETILTSALGSAYPSTPGGQFYLSVRFGRIGAVVSLKSISYVPYISPDHRHLYHCLPDGLSADCRKTLPETDLPIGTVSENCGFTDHSNFGRIFMTETGLSPSQFRKKYHE